MHSLRYHQIKEFSSREYKKYCLVHSSRFMGIGDDTLGATIVKAFTFQLIQQEVLPTTLIFYNGGAFLTCEGSPLLDDPI